MLPVVVLAGGLGTRLVTLTGDTMPKALVSVAGRPFIDHKLAELTRGGATDVTLLVGHHGDQLATHVGDGSRFGLRARVVPDGPQLLGTGGALAQVVPSLPDRFWVTYGDSLLDVDVVAAEAAFDGAPRTALMTVLPTATGANARVRDGLVVAYAKDPAPAGARHIDYGMLLLTRAAFTGRPTGSAFDLVDILSDLAARGELTAFEVHEPFHEIGTPAALQETEAYLRDRSSPTESSVS